MADLNAQIDLLRKEAEVNNKSNGLEFQRIAGAFQKQGNLIDLLYLEVAVLLDILSKKKILSEKEFAEQLEETSKNIADHMKKAQEKKSNLDKDNLASTLDSEKKDEPKIKTTE